MNNEHTAEAFAYGTGTTLPFARDYLSHRFSTIGLAYEAFEEEKHRLWLLAWQSQATKRIALADGTLKLPEGIPVCTVVSLLVEVQKRTGLTVEYAHFLLARTGWDLRRAVAVFQKHKYRLPPEASQLISQLSCRTGMTANYSQKYLGEAKWNYSNAVVSFSRDHGQLPAIAFAQIPHITTFLDLPGELRNRVYELVFYDEQRDAGRCVDIRTRIPGILRVNAQIRNEVSKMYFSGVNFLARLHIEERGSWLVELDTIQGKTLLDWLDILGTANVARLHTLTIIVVQDYYRGHNRYSCFSDEEQYEIIDAWDCFAASLRIRGVRAQQLRITDSWSNTQFEPCHKDRVIIWSLLGKCVTVAQLLVDVRLAETENWPVSIAEMIRDEKSPETEWLYKTFHRMEGSREPYWRMWAPHFREWLSGKREKMNRMPKYQRN